LVYLDSILLHANNLMEHLEKPLSSFLPTSVCGDRCYIPNDRIWIEVVDTIFTENADLIAQTDSLLDLRFVVDLTRINWIDEQNNIPLLTQDAAQDTIYTGGGFTYYMNNFTTARNAYTA